MANPISWAGVERSALLSPDGVYRYRLDRWDTARQSGAPLLGWIMFNPSTADATIDDRTIRRLIGFSQSWGYQHFSVANLFALRSPYPEDVENVLYRATGEQNDAHIARLAISASMLILAWGYFPWAAPRVTEVLGLLKSCGANDKVRVLVQNKDGSPGHPLYLRGSLAPIEPDWAALRARKPPPRPSPSARGPMALLGLSGRGRPLPDPEKG